jgi:hypothetical protein
MNALRAPGDNGQGTPAPRPARSRRRTAALALAAVAFIAVAATAAAAAGGGALPASRSLITRSGLTTGSGPSGSLLAADVSANGGVSPHGVATPGGGTSHAISILAGPAATVEMRAAPGQVTIVGSATGMVRLTGKLQWTGHAPVTRAGLNRVHGVLRLSYRCAAGSPCTGNYRLVVPWHTAIMLTEPSGHVVISDLAGPLRIIAHHVDISATGLRTPSLRAAITSGHLGATFDAAPRHIALTLVSAQATLRLPASTDYAVGSQVTAGYVHVGIPENASAAHNIEVRIDSGELELLSR